MTIHVNLTDGNVIESDAENNFPAFRDVGYPTEFHVCTVCPIREECQDTDDFACMENGMFEGYRDLFPLTELRRVGAIVEEPC